MSSKLMLSSFLRAITLPTIGTSEVLSIQASARIYGHSFDNMSHGLRFPSMSISEINSTRCSQEVLDTPLIFHPVFSRRRWGGRKLGELLGKQIGPESDFAESWEVADHADGQSVVCSGAFAGQPLSDLIAAHNDDLFGRAAGQSQFPLLIKYLDANDWLSLQVHPNDQQAKKYVAHENGKTEAWVILHAEPESQICCGLKEGVTAAELKVALEQGSVEHLLHVYPVKVGDCVFVPAGTVHAIGPGIVLAEVQQQSNLTFRLHDWGRLDSDGKPREIHVEESLGCIDFDRGPVPPTNPVNLSSHGHTFEELVRCPYFAIRRHSTVDSFALTLDQRFRVLMLLSGTASIRTPQQESILQAGQTALIPAACDRVEVQAIEGRATVLEVLQSDLPA